MKDELYKTLELLPEWPLIEKYRDSVVSHAINSHDIKHGYRTPDNTEGLRLYKLAIKKCLELGIDVAVMDILNLVFLSETDIDKKLLWIKSTKRKIK
jgi:hypothetical protein